MSSAPSSANLGKPTGITGLKHNDGIIEQEWLKVLKGTSGRRVLREMIDNDDTVGSILFSFRFLITQMKWWVDPDLPDDAEATPADEEAAEFVDQCRVDMSDDWSMVLSEILTFLAWGFGLNELVYKRRQGMQSPDGRSKYDDGKIGWRSWPGRPQDTIARWILDPGTGRVMGVVQENPNGNNPPPIPIEKLLLFRTTAERGNPEGRSILRNAWESWYYKKNIARIEAIGIERDLAGLPVAYVPDRIANPVPGDDVALAANLEWKKILQNLRVDDQAGVLISRGYDDKGNPDVELKLLSTGGTRNHDTGAVIKRYSAAMAQSVLADFIQLGHESVGSFALADSKTSLFAYAVGAFADIICAVVNQHAIPRLLELNGMTVDHWPILKHGDVESADLAALADYVSKLGNSGFITADPTLENALRETASLPPADAEYIPPPPDFEAEAEQEAAALAAFAGGSPPAPGESEAPPGSQPPPPSGAGGAAPKTKPDVDPKATSAPKRTPRPGAPAGR